MIYLYRRCVNAQLTRLCVVKIFRIDLPGYVLNVDVSPVLALQCFEKVFKFFGEQADIRLVGGEGWLICQDISIVGHRFLLLLPRTI